MPRLLRRLPFHHAKTARPDLAPGARASGCQIVIHLGIAPMARPGEPQHVPPPDLNPVPVVLDTGFTHGLLLRTGHLARLTAPESRYTTADFDATTGGKVRLVRRKAPGEAGSPKGGEEVRARHARVWVYPNTPGSWRWPADCAPVFLPLPHGIIIAPTDDLTPAEMRCPLLGLGGLDDCGLFVRAWAKHLDVWAGRPRWWEVLASALRERG